MKRALITGVSGQDGSYLAELLLERGYRVHGIKRRSSSFNTSRIDHLIGHKYFQLHYGDVTDVAGLLSLFQEVMPDEIYNLAGQSHVQVSFELPAYTAQVNAVGALNVFEAARIICRDALIYQASSSEMFGNASDPIQCARTALKPVSPYACSKTTAHHLAAVYRESYGMSISCGILFNHESPRRGETFFPAKLVRGAVAIKRNRQKELQLGNMRATRDWGWAPEYVDAMTKIINTNEDFVVGTGISVMVCDAVAYVFDRLGLNCANYVTYDNDAYIRPYELRHLQADTAHTTQRLNWKAKNIGKDVFDKLLEAELQRVHDLEAV